MADLENKVNNAQEKEEKQNDEQGDNEKNSIRLFTRLVPNLIDEEIIDIVKTKVKDQKMSVLVREMARIWYVAEQAKQSDGISFFTTIKKDECPEEDWRFMKEKIDKVGVNKEAFLKNAVTSHRKQSEGQFNSGQTGSTGETGFSLNKERKQELAQIFNFVLKKVLPGYLQQEEDMKELLRGVLKEILVKVLSEQGLNSMNDLDLNELDFDGEDNETQEEDQLKKELQKDINNILNDGEI